MIILSGENRELLRRQLEQQGKMLVAENNDVKLVQSILTTCSALLRVAEKLMPTSLSQEAFNGVYAGYLGVSSKVNSFYSNHTVYFNENQSQVLRDLLESLHSLEKAKKDLDNKIFATQKEIESGTRNIESSKKILEGKEKRHKELISELEKLREQLWKIERTIFDLEKELTDINERINDFEPDVERLIAAINDARSTYAEMIAYYAELERIQNGIKDEGYVDIVSFSQKLQGMNTQGRKLMNLYDELLRNITADVEALQKKIEMKRKAGVAG